jgi:hypothetical protein
MLTAVAAGTGSATCANRDSSQTRRIAATRSRAPMRQPVRVSVRLLLLTDSPVVSPTESFVGAPLGVPSLLAAIPIS